MRALSYILPGRFGASEALAELVFSASQLLTLFNDDIFREGKITCGENASSKRNPVLLWLTVMEYLEVFIELGSLLLWGEIGRWIIVVVLQIAKAALRFALLFKYNSGVQRTPLIPPLDRSKLEKIREDVGEENLTDEACESEEPSGEGDSVANPGTTWRGS